MRIVTNLRERFPMLFRAIMSSVVIGVLGGVATFAESAMAEDSCCYPGSPCCYPGSPCCAHNHHATK